MKENGMYKQVLVIIAIALIAGTGFAEDESFTNKQEVVTQPAKIELANTVELHLDGPTITWTYNVQALDADGKAVPLVIDGETVDKPAIQITLAEWKQVLTSMGIDAPDFASKLQKSLLKAAKYKLK